MYQIGPSNIFLILVFLISFIVLHYSLIRVFSRQPASGSILAILFAAGITYGIWNYGFDVQGLFYNFGLDISSLYLIAPILVIIKIMIIAFLFGFSTAMIILGGLLMVLSYWAYEKTVIFVIGSVIMIIGLFMLNSRLKRKDAMRKA